MSEKPYISRKDQARLTQKKIFDTTLVLIRMKGYQKVTIREICQNAQISIGTFYLYFSSKDDILMEVYNKLDAKVDMPNEEAHLSGNERICNFFLCYLTNMIDMFDKSLLREIFRINLVSGRDDFLSETRSNIRTVTALLQYEKEHGRLLSEEPIPSLCRKIHMLVQSYVFHWLANNDLGNEFLTETCIHDLKHFLTLYIASGEPSQETN